MKTHLKTLAVAGITLALLGWSLSGVDLANVVTAIRDADPLRLLLLLAVTGLTYVLRAYRWQYLLHPIGKTHFRTAFRTTVIGFAANTVLPLRAGELVRPYLLARSEGLSVPAATTTILLERLLDLVTVLALFGVFLAFFAPPFAKVDPQVYSKVKSGGLLMAAVAAAIVVLLALNAARPALAHRLVDLCLAPLPDGLERRLSGLVYGLLDGLAVTRDPVLLAQSFALSLPLWLSIASGVWLTTTAFHMTIPFTGSFLFIAFLTVGVAVPTPGAVGGFHAAFRTAAVTFYDASVASAVGGALVLHAASFLPVTLLGALFMFQDGLSLARVKRINDEARAEAGAVQA